MFLHPIIEWLDSLKSSDQFRKWAALSVKISGVFTLSYYLRIGHCTPHTCAEVY